MCLSVSLSAMRSALNACYMLRAQHALRTQHALRVQRARQQRVNENPPRKVPVSRDRWQKPAADRHTDTHTDTSTYEPVLLYMYSREINGGPLQWSLGLDRARGLFKVRYISAYLTQRNFE